MELTQRTITDKTLPAFVAVLQNNLLFLWLLLVFKLAHQQVFYAGWIADSYFFVLILRLLLLVLKGLLDSHISILFVLSAWALSFIYSKCNFWGILLDWVHNLPFLLTYINVGCCKWWFLLSQRQFIEWFFSTFIHRCIHLWTRVYSYLALTPWTINTENYLVLVIRWLHLFLQFAYIKRYQSLFRIFFLRACLNRIFIWCILRILWINSLIMLWFFPITVHMVNGIPLLYILLDLDNFSQLYLELMIFFIPF